MTIKDQITKIDEFLATAEEKYKKSVQDNLEHKDLLEKLAELFPTAEEASTNGYPADLEVKLPPVKTVEEAIALAKSFNLLPMVKARNGYYLFTTPERMHKCTESVDIEPYTVRTGDYWGTRIQFFVKELDKVIKVEAKIESGEIRGTGRLVEFPGGKRYENCKAVDLTGTFERQVQWARGSLDHLPDFTLYNLL